MNGIKATIQGVLRAGLVLTLILLLIGSLFHLLGWEQLSQFSLLVGIWALMLTPILRVLTSLIYFHQEGDKLYQWITLVVLAIIAGSIIFA